VVEAEPDISFKVLSEQKPTDDQIINVSSAAVQDLKPQTSQMANIDVNFFSSKLSMFQIDSI